MIKSKTKIGKQLQRKTNPELVETIISAKKNENWLEVARILSTPRRKMMHLNLNELNEKINNSNNPKKVVFPGKILSKGEIDKKCKIIAFKFSEKAKEKLLKNGCTISTIIDEIKLNPSANEITILK